MMVLLMVDSDLFDLKNLRIYLLVAILSPDYQIMVPFHFHQLAMVVAFHFHCLITFDYLVVLKFDFLEVLTSNFHCHFD